jgi:hypothetical protein
MANSSGRIPDAIEPIVGYRIWGYALVMERSWLRSLTSAECFLCSGEGAWDTAGWSWTLASCSDVDLGVDLEIPGEECKCGFYAMDTMARLLEEAEDIGDFPSLIDRGRLKCPDHSFLSDVRVQIGIVAGRIQMAGKIIEHQHGFRAERARIVELFPIEGTEPCVRVLGAQLRVPIGPPVRLPVVDDSTLWKRLNKGSRARGRLITRYARLVEDVADRVAAERRLPAQRDELFACGMVALIASFERFDPEGSIDFEAYAITRITKSITALAERWRRSIEMAIRRSGAGPLPNF